MKKRGKQPTKAQHTPLIISEEIDKMRDDIHNVLGGNEDIRVRLVRSRRETKVFITLKGNLEKTEKNLQRIYKGLTKKS